MLKIATLSSLPVNFSPYISAQKNAPFQNISTLSSPKNYNPFLGILNALTWPFRVIFRGCYQSERAKKIALIDNFLKKFTLGKSAFPEYESMKEVIYDTLLEKAKMFLEEGLAKAFLRNPFTPSDIDIVRIAAKNRAETGKHLLTSLLEKIKAQL